MIVRSRKPNGTSPDWLRAARSRGLLSRVPESLVLELTADAHRVEYPKGAIILRWPDSPTSLVVLRGAARTFLADQEGRQVTTRYLRVGDVVGLVRQSEIPVSRGLHVIEHCELLELSQHRIRELSSSNPVIAAAVIEELAVIMSGILCSFSLRTFGTIRQRVVSAIVHRAALAGGLTSVKNVPGTQHELAMAVGSVREVVAAVLQELKRDGLIDVRRGSVIILEPEGLAREAVGWPDCFATDEMEPAPPLPART